MWQNEIKYKALTKQPLHALQLLFENCTSFLTKQLFYSDSLQLLEEVSKDPGIDEAWIDLMVENWEDILGSKDTMRKLPGILSVLSESVVSWEYLNKLRNLRGQNTSSQSQVISALLEQAIKTAEENINWIEENEQEIIRVSSLLNSNM